MQAISLIHYILCNILQRPRKIGAKYTGDMIAPDEYIQPQLSFDYDGKRDRWNGFDPNEHQKVIDDYAKIEEVCIRSKLFLAQFVQGPV